MFSNLNFNFDRISFWLGFLAASLLWWLWMRVRSLLPIWHKQIRQYIVLLQQRNLSGLENAARRDALRRAQHGHLAAPLFPLDDVLIEPKLLAPPAELDGDSQGSFSIAAQVVPYLPDWPELVSPFGVPTITLAQAMESDRNIIVIGQPGSGKSVALAHLASQLARGEITTGPLVNAFPIYVHALDLDPTIPEGKEPLANLIRVLSSQVGVVYQAQAPKLLRALLQDAERRLVFIVDGLDELPAQALEAHASYLGALSEQYPSIRMIAAASATCADGLLKAGFYPLGLAAWTPRQRIQFTEKWSALWTEQVVPDAQKQIGAYPEIDKYMVTNWLSGETTYTSPLEWTLRLWGAYAGDGSGSNFLSVLDTHIARWLPVPMLMPALEELGHHMVTTGAASLNFDAMEHLLSNVRIAQPQALSAEAMQEAEAVLAEPAEGEEQKAKKGKKQKTQRVSQGEKIIDGLIKGGLLIEHGSGQIRFITPVFLGYLAGMRAESTDTEQFAMEFLDQNHWIAREQTLRFAAACDENAPWMEYFLDLPDVPLCRNLLSAARWLRDVPAAAPWRSQMMRALVTLMQNDLLPLSTRARLAGAFTLTGDPSIAKLFKSLLGSKSSDVRRMALLGCGALANPQLITDVLTMMADNEPDVRHTACLAIAAIPGEVSLSTIVQVLLEGDEDIRQAAAEALALIPGEGHQALQEAITFDDLLTRRAAVFGLVQVNKPWAREALEKTAVADGQWVVRNAAAQALETLQASYAGIPKPLPQPAESPEMLAFAGKQGIGIAPDDPATELLVRALATGTTDEKIVAMQYLREEASEGIVRELYQMIYGGREDLIEPAMQTLWWMALSGAKLPHPMQFGLS